MAAAAPKTWDEEFAARLAQKQAPSPAPPPADAGADWDAEFAARLRARTPAPAAAPMTGAAPAMPPVTAGAATAPGRGGAPSTSGAAPPAPSAPRPAPTIPPPAAPTYLGLPQVEQGGKPVTHAVAPTAADVRTMAGFMLSPYDVSMVPMQGAARPIRYQPLPGETRVKQAEAALKKLPPGLKPAPYKPGQAGIRAPERRFAEEGPVRQLIREQDLAYVQLGRELPGLQQQLETDRADLGRRWQELAALGKTANAPRQMALFRQLKAELDEDSRRHDQRRAQLLEYGKRSAAVVRRYETTPMHLGLAYPHEARESPTAASEFFRWASQSPGGRAAGWLGSFIPFIGVLQGPDANNFRRARAALMLTGEYPPSVPLPEGISENLKEALTQQKNAVAHAARVLWDRLNPDGTLSMEVPPALMSPAHRTALATLQGMTPWQRKLLPTVLQQVRAEMKAYNAVKDPELLTEIVSEIVGEVAGHAAGRAAGRMAQRWLGPVLAEPLESVLARQGLRQSLGRIALTGAVQTGAGIVSGGAGGGIGAGAAALAAGQTPEQALQQARVGTVEGAKAGALLSGLGFIRETRRSALGRSWNEKYSPAVVEAIADDLQRHFGLNMENRVLVTLHLEAIHQAPAWRKFALARDLERHLSQFEPVDARRRVRVGRAGQPAPSVKEIGRVGVGRKTPAPAATPTPLPEPAAPEVTEPQPLIGPPAPVETQVQGQPARQMPPDALQQAAAVGDPRATGLLELHRLHQEQMQPELTAEQQAEFTDWKKRYGGAGAALERQLFSFADTTRPTNPALAAKLQQAGLEQQRWVKWDWHHTGIDAPRSVAPPTVSVWRTLTDQEKAALPADAKKALLLQDIHNSQQVLSPGSDPIFSPRDLPERVKNEGQWVDLADRKFAEAEAHLDSLYPYPELAAPEAASVVTAPPAGEPITPSPPTARTPEPGAAGGDTPGTAAIPSEPFSSPRPPTEADLVPGTIVRAGRKTWMLIEPADPTNPAQSPWLIAEIDAVGNVYRHDLMHREGLRAVDIIHQTQVVTPGDLVAARKDEALARGRMLKASEAAAEASYHFGADSPEATQAAAVAERLADEYLALLGDRPATILRREAAAERTARGLPEPTPAVSPEGTVEAPPVPVESAGAPAAEMPAPAPEAPVAATEALPAESARQYRNTRTGLVVTKLGESGNQVRLRDEAGREFSATRGAFAQNYQAVGPATAARTGVQRQRPARQKALPPKPETPTPDRLPAPPPKAPKEQFLAELRAAKDRERQTGEPVNRRDLPTYQANEAAVRDAQTGQPVAVTGFRQEKRGTRVPQTGVFYAIDPATAGEYGKARGTERLARPRYATSEEARLGEQYGIGVKMDVAAEGGNPQKLTVDRLRFENPLVIDGGHQDLVREIEQLPFTPAQRQSIRSAWDSLIQRKGEAGYALLDKALAQAARKAGFDGVIFRRRDPGGTEVVDLRGVQVLGQKEQKQAAPKEQFLAETESAKAAQTVEAVERAVEATTAMKENTAALSGAKTGQAIALVGFRQPRGEKVQGAGVYYAAHPAGAGSYGRLADPTTSALEAEWGGKPESLVVERVELKNPLVLDQPIKSTGRLIESLPALGFSPAVVRRAEERLREIRALGLWDVPGIDDQVVAQAARDEGYDGLIFKSDLWGMKGAEIVDLRGVEPTTKPSAKPEAAAPAKPGPRAATRAREELEAETARAAAPKAKEGEVIREAPAGKPLWEMSLPELDEAYRRTTESDRELSARLFGKEDGARYERLQRRAHSSTATAQQVDEAVAEIQRMESTLTDAERNELYGIGQEVLDPQEIQEYRRVIGSLDTVSAADLGESLKWALTKVGQETDPAKMTAKERVYYAALREGMRIAQERGFDTAEVTRVALKGAAERFKDPEDARFMLRRFVREADAEPPRGTAAKPPVAALPAPAGPVAMGRRATFTAGGKKVQGQFALVEAGDLVTSNTDSLGVNPAYPKELQPRDRGRMASREQISELENKLDPELLGENPLAQHGAPIVGDDRVVESGNGRAIALRRLYGRDDAKAAEYKAWLKENAEQFGLKPEDVEQARAPVLVRVRTTEMTPAERTAFTRAANARETAEMGPAEQAVVDAERLTPDLMRRFNPDQEGNLSAASNREFIRKFMATLPQAERSGLIQADGQLSQKGLVRVRNAVFQEVYGDPQALTRLAEATDDPAKNVTTALLRAAAPLAELQGKIGQGTAHPLDIAPEVAQAAATLAGLREQGRSVGEILDQESMFEDEVGGTLSPLARDVLQFMDDNKRSAKKIAAALAGYVDLAEAAGNPAIVSALADKRPPTREELWRAAREKASEAEQPGLFAEKAGPEAGVRAARGGGAAEAAAARPPDEKGAGGAVGRKGGFVLGSLPATKPAPQAAKTGVASMDAFYEKNYGAIPQAGTKKSLVRRLVHNYIREFEHLPETGEKVGLKTLLGRLRFRDDWATRAALNQIYRIYGGLDDRQLYRVGHVWFVKDAAESLRIAQKKWAAVSNEPFPAAEYLPEGITEADVFAAEKVVDGWLKKDGDLYAHTIKVRTLRDEFIRPMLERQKRVFGRSADLDERHWYLRRQIQGITDRERYLTADQKRQRGKAGQAPRTIAPLMERKGGVYDYNTNILESELDWMRQVALYDLDLQVVEHLKNTEDLQPAIRAAGIWANNEKAAQMIADVAAGAPPDPQLLTRLGDLAAQDVLPHRFDGKFTELIDELALWRLLNRQAQTAGQPAIPLDPAVAAKLPEYANYLQFLKTKHGKLSAGIPAGYREVPFNNRPSTHTAYTVPEQEALAAIQAATDLVLSPDEIKARRVLGRQPKMVLPDAVADTLAQVNFQAPDSVEGYLGRKLMQGQNIWKAAVLYNPMTNMAQFVTNTTGDLHRVFMGDPEALKAIMEPVKVDWPEPVAALQEMTQAGKSLAERQAALGRLTASMKAVPLAETARATRRAAQERILTKGETLVRETALAVGKHLWMERYAWSPRTRKWKPMQAPPEWLADWLEFSGGQSRMTYEGPGGQKLPLRFQTSVGRTQVPPTAKPYRKVGAWLWNQTPTLRTLGAMGLDLAQVGHEHREMTLRASLYRFALDYQKKHGTLPSAGLSKPEQLMAIKDPKERAFFWSEDMVGSYQRRTQGGRWLARYVAPFARFIEIRNSGMVRGALNAMAQPENAQRFGQRLLASGKIPKALQGDVAKSASRMVHLGLFAQRALSLSALMGTAAYAFWPDEAEEVEEAMPGTMKTVPLPGTERRVGFSTVLLSGGMDPLGKIGAYRNLDVVGGFLDDWFGATAFGRSYEEFKNGRISWLEMAADVTTENWLNQGYQQLGPHLKLYDLAGYRTYPNVFERRLVKDQKQAFFDAMTLGPLYRWIQGKPQKQDWLMRVATGRSQIDPGQASFWDARKNAEEWLEKQGKPALRTVPWENAKASAVQWLIDAQRRGDTNGMTHYLGLYAQNGGHIMGLERYMKAQDPLRDIGDADMVGYLNQLKPAEARRLRRAYLHYWRLLGEGEQVADIINEPHLPKFVAKMQAKIEKGIAKNELLQNVPTWDGLRKQMIENEKRAEKVRALLSRGEPQYLGEEPLKVKQAREKRVDEALDEIRREEDAAASRSTLPMQMIDDLERSEPAGIGGPMGLPELVSPGR